MEISPLFAFKIEGLVIENSAMKELEILYEE